MAVQAMSLMDGSVVEDHLIAGRGFGGCRIEAKPEY